MKKQLLATLLAFTPFFAFSNQQPTNSELLAHLKQTKTALKDISIQIPEDYEQEYKNRKNEAQALYNFIQNNIPTNDIDACFNALCNQKQLNEIIFCLYVKIWSRFLENNFTNNHKEEIKTILNNFINDYKETIEALSYPTHNYNANKYTPEERIVNLFIGSRDRDAIFIMVIIENIRNSLLEKIDAKIAELEQ